MGCNSYPIHAITFFDYDRENSQHLYQQLFYKSIHTLSNIEYAFRVGTSYSPWEVYGTWINDERSTFLQVILCGLARGVDCAHPQADVPTEGHEKHGGGTKNTEIYSLEKKLPHASITENARQHQDTMRVPTHDVLLLWIERHSANCPHREVGLQAAQPNVRGCLGNIRVASGFTLMVVKYKRMGQLNITMPTCNQFQGPFPQS